MPRRKKTPTGGTVGAGAAGQVAAVQPIKSQYSTRRARTQPEAKVKKCLLKSSTRRARTQPPRALGLPLDLSRQIDCCLYLEEGITDPLTRRFAAILRRRLEESIPSESRP